MYTHFSAAGPAAASTGTGGAASGITFRVWESKQLTTNPELSKQQRNEPPKPLPKDPEVGYVCRSEKGRKDWVLEWKYQRSKIGAPRSLCRKESFWRYDPVKYKELLEKFKSESGEAGNAASSTGGAGSSAVSGTGAATSSTSSAAGAGEYMQGDTFDPEPSVQEPLAPATGAAGSTAACIASPVPGDALAVPDMNTLYHTLLSEDKLPKLKHATDHGPKKRKEGRLYYIKGEADEGFQLYIDRNALKPSHFRGWKRPPSIYIWNPEAK